MNKKRKLLAAIALSFTTCMSAYAGTPINKIVVIGESTSDGGNAPTAVISNYKYYLENKSARNKDIVGPNGEQTPFYPDYRFSNGPVAVEQLAGLYKDPLNDNMSMNDTSHFFNLAYGGLHTHVMRANKNYINAKINSKLTFDDKTLVIIWIGGNNLITELPEDVPDYAYDGIIGASLTAGMTAAEVQASPPQAINIGIDDIQDEMAALWGMGARHFAVIGMPDLAKFPCYYTKNEAQKSTITALSDAWNTALVNRIAAMNNWAVSNKYATTNPIVYIDLKKIFNGAYDIVNNPINGFRKPYEYAFKSATLNAPASGLCVTEANVSNAAACPNSIKEKLLFWDEVHPTQKAHEYFANEFKAKLNDAGLQIAP